VSENTIRVVVTGVSWMGGGVGSIESALEQIFREVEQEITITAYAISSGADLLLDWMEAALARGVKIRLIVNRKDEQPSGVVNRIRSLSNTYSHLHFYDFTANEGADLHAKVIVADRRVALLGSSNLSRRGLLNNHEMAVLIHGAAANTVAVVVDKLFDNKSTTRIN
jgi:phosphatidylserine/phosphatidylglycerophosphate/cardiolipin synthase-like enzyme